MAISRLGRRSKIMVGAVAVLACLAVLASYLYVRYVDVVRFSAEHGRITVDAAPAGTLGTVLVTNKGYALYMFAPDAARHVTCTGGCATYTYLGDADPGHADGQGADDDGGYWYVMRPSGQIAGS
jgi:hypothetical protein